MSDSENTGEVCRSHFSSLGNAGKKFPIEHMKHFQYIYNQTLDKLVNVPNHIVGNTVTKLDYSYWLSSNNKNLLTVLEKLAFNEHKHPIEILDLSNHSTSLDACRITLETLQFIITSFSSTLNTLILNYRQFSISLSYLTNTLDLDYYLVEEIIKLHNLKTLSLVAFEFLTDSQLEIILTKMPQLTSLDISSCVKLTDVSLLILAKSQQQLIATAISCYNLESLNISYNLNYTFVGVNEVLLRCEGLTSFDMSGCMGVNFAGIVIKTQIAGVTQFASRSLQTIKARGCRNLCTLSLDWLISSSTSPLEHIDMSYIKHLTDAQAQAIAFSGFGNDGKGHLKSLNLEGCIHVSACTLAALALKSSNSLRWLNISKTSETMTSKAIAELLRNCYNLESLDISHNTGIDDLAFSLLLENDHVTKPLKLKLLHLNIGGCKNITSVGVTALAQLAGDVLQYLNISGQRLVTDSAVLVLVQKCRNLRVLDLSDCVALSDTAVMKIALELRFLQALLLSSKTRNIDAWGNRFVQYSDKSLLYLMRFARNLKVLELCNQAGITFNAFKTTKTKKSNTTSVLSFSGHFSLEKLDLRGVDGSEMAVEGLRNLLGMCPALNHVVLPLDAAGTVLTSREFFESAFPDKPITTSGNVAYRHGAYCKTFEQRSNIVITAGLVATYYSSNSNGIDNTAVNCCIDLNIDRRKIKHHNLEAHIPVIRSNNSSSMFSPAMLAKIAPVPFSKGFVVLEPHDEMKSLRYVDDFTRRRILEMQSAGLLQSQWKRFRLWIRLKYKLSARRIANTYKIILEKRKFKIRVQIWKENYLIKKIQYRFRSSVMRYAFPCMRIQRFYRGCLLRRRVVARVVKGRAAIEIQRIVRGFLVRVSERFVLAQIYLRLPAFWKDFMNNNKAKMEEAGSDKTSLTRQMRNSTSVFHYQIAGLREEVSKATQHILNDIVRDGVLPPAIPFLVPQPFDKKPYASRADGRRVDFYSQKNSILSFETSEETTEEKYKNMKNMKNNKNTKQLKNNNNKNNNINETDKKRRNRYFSWGKVGSDTYF